jgi:soluble cytochrome b562
MSVAGILSSAVVNFGVQAFQNRMHKVQTEFQQLGQDLKSGNLSAAQSDFATLQQLRAPASSTSSTRSSSTITQDFKQLATDLKAGNTTAAQKDYAQIQKDIQTQPPTMRHHHRHTNGDSGGVSQLLTQLGSALQSGNLTAAQQAYATMQQDLQQYASGGAMTAQTVSSGISAIA